jgi:virginiamycin B lyase
MTPMLLALALLLAALLPRIASAAEVAYYELPRGAFAHDVAPAPEGSVWYTDQRQGRLGRLDPGSGKVEEIPLGRGSSPHGVVVGPDGAAWITDGGQNAIVRVEPASKAVKVYPLPQQFAGASLNTGVFDARDIYWFTGQSGVYGRVDPAAGKVEAWRAPKGIGPYGITATPSGEVWYASLAGNYIGRIDPATAQASVVEPPRQGVGPRRIWSDSKGILWASFWNSGEIGRYDPAAHAWKTWKLPKSKSGCYAIYVDEADKIWISDWPANALERFDPATERFDTFASDKPDADVRQLAGRPGEVWGAQSGLGRLVVVRH